MLSRPPPGEYVIRVRNYAAHGHASTARATFDAGGRRRHRRGRQRGLRRLLRLLRRAQHDAVRERASPRTCGRTAPYGKPGAADNWHIAARPGPAEALHHLGADGPDRRAHGLRDARRLQPPLAAAGRRRRRRRGRRRSVGVGHVYKSTDAGETFRDISGNLPDIPADFAIVRNGQLIVATDLGVFISADTDGGTYERLGDGAAERAGVLARAQAEGERGGARHADRRHAGPRRLPLRVRRAPGKPAIAAPDAAAERRRPRRAGAGARAARTRSPARRAARCPPRARAARARRCGSASRARSRGR